MSWARFDDQYPDHPKIIEAGPLGMALHMAATCYCARYLTDGFVPAAMISRLVSFDGICTVDINGVSNTVTNKTVTEMLVKVGLFEIAPGGYLVHDYLEYNPAGADVKAERSENAARQKKWRDENRKKDGKFGSNEDSNALRDTLVTSAPSPSPLLKDNNADQPESELSHLSAFIANLLHVPEYKGGVEVWFAGLNDLKKIGATEAQIEKAYHALKSSPGKRYTIVGPQSLVTAVSNLIQDEEDHPNKSKPQYKRRGIGEMI